VLEYAKMYDQRLQPCEAERTWCLLILPCDIDKLAALQQQSNLQT